MADPGPSSTSHAPGLGVEIVRRAEIWDRLALSDAQLARAAEAAFLAAPRQGAFEATLVLADDAEMRALNRAWRGKDASTNVLSFPAGAMAHGEEPCPLGDVVLAAETVQREAEGQAIPLADHAAHLVVHGMLHLLGFDHERADDAERMEALETQVLAGLGIADPYAEPVKDAAEISP
jgi:probable rRNA maturation factor